MMRSLYSGVAGLNAHQTRMDVIGHNISNVNTVGYKKDRVTFQEMLSQMVQWPAGPTAQRGGINPMQIGLGVQVGSIDTNHEQGSMETTGHGTDLAIDGNGFFILRDGINHFYSRAGNHSLDNRGYLVNSGNGMHLQGWTADSATGAISTEGDLEDIRIPMGDIMGAETTNYMDFSGNLDSDAEIGEVYQTAVSAYDEFGSRHEVVLNFEKTANNEWELTMDNDGSFEIDLIVGDAISLEFEEGRLQLVNGEDLDTGGLIANIDLFNFDNGASDINELDILLENITQFSGASSVEASDLDGNNMGSLQSFTIDEDGVVVGTYTNGVTRNLAQVGLANFNNADGLLKEGDTLFSESINSGIPQIGRAGTAGRGDLRTASLEMSNVDLAEEFSNMVITQRGYQANSRIITTVDQMLQELVNMGR